MPRIAAPDLEGNNLMTVITIDRSTGEKLRGLTGPVQLRDERGELLGEFRPAPALRSVYDGLESPLSEEELVRRERETDTLGTSDVMEMLNRMSRANVSPEAFPITRDRLHE